MQQAFFYQREWGPKKTLDTLGLSSDYLCPRQQFTGSPDKLRIAEVNLRVLLNYPKEGERERPLVEPTVASPGTGDCRVEASFCSIFRK